MLSSKWRPVHRSHPCPICSKPDWCQVSTDGKAAICRRVVSDKPLPKGGWLHRLDGKHPPLIPPSTPQPEAPRVDLMLMARGFATAVNPSRLARLADELGLSVESLKDLGVGWAGEQWCGKCHRRLGAWSFPMMDVAQAGSPQHNNVLGFRLRFVPCGHKSAIRGGKEGLFISKRAGMDAGSKLFVCEGPTDTAALLDLGLAAIGRPSCTGGLFLIRDLLRSRHRAGFGITQLVIVADGDVPGQNGAKTLASVARLICPIVQIITPPAGIKDARAWKQSGATAADVERAVWAAPRRTLSVTTHQNIKLKGIRS